MCDLADSTGYARQRAAIAARFSKATGLKTQNHEALVLSCRLLNLGGIPATLVAAKNGRLEGDEFNIIKRHCQLGAKLARQAKPLAEMGVPDIILAHHERLDGRGYPHGLTGDEIPYLARMVAIVDCYNAMISDRPYRRAVTPKNALEQLTSSAGQHLDKDMVEAFVGMINTELHSR
jgi:HD-GYP domain-containing protein (c-di-GMP phosphodiesterase class II)